jgi:predicted PurR-regulated permease PerM
MLVTVVAGAAGLYFLRDVLTPLAMAILLWFAIDALAHALSSRFRLLPRWLALPIAIALAIAGVASLAALVIQNVSELTVSVGARANRLDLLLAEAQRLAHINGPPTNMSQLVSQIDLGRALSAVAAAAQSLAAQTALTLVYLVFMFPAAATAPQKLDRIFPLAADRERVRRVITAIRQSMTSYFWVQTVAGMLIAILTLATLSIIGVHNAFYWAVLMFFLNFIPLIGAILGVALPTIFAALQFSDPTLVAATALGVGVWPVLVGNLLLPRMTGRSLNLSPLVVVLALGFWGTLWGVVGAFLATPLSVMIMIVLAQFPRTEPIAIIMSADAQPTVISPNG